MIGRTLSHYLIEGRLGKGGMGEVFVARDLRLERRVALKILASGGGPESDSERRFVAEAKAASALNHPNIVTVHDFDQDGEIRFLVMELVEGEPLSSLTTEKLPTERFFALASQITSALAAAHAAGIVHHDIKPGNLMLSQSGTIKVVDFGLARRLGENPSPGPDQRRPPSASVDLDQPTLKVSESLTEPGTILGTLTYMAPEQLEGQRGNARSDIFSLGILFFELLTAERPFGGESPVAIMTAILRDPPKNLGVLRPDLPPRLVALIQRCLNKNPAERFADAGELSTELAALRQAISDAAAAKPGGGKALMVAGLALFLLAAIPLALWWRDVAQERRVREALPEIDRRFEAEDPVGALVLAQEIMALAPNDAQVQQTWTNLSFALDITSEPAGAEVAIHSYRNAETGWVTLGHTPLTAQVPYPILRYRVQKPGYAPVEVAPEVDERLHFRLFPESEAQPGMVAVTAGAVKLPSLSAELPDFWIDRHEVTNAEFQKFVQAGAYQRPEFWKYLPVAEGRAIPLAAAAAAWVDTTGRPGPANWAFGTFPEGQGEHPVAGISFFEAAAYAEFVGKQLPTIYHWSRAAHDNGYFSDILGSSNYHGQGTVPVGSLGGLGAWGTLDMAGNVKEWCLNAAGDARYALGGGFADAAYSFADLDALDPATRRPDVGFRLIRQASAVAPALLAELSSEPAELAPAADAATFALYARNFDYDPRPLEAKVEAIDDRHTAWRKETVSYTAAYDGSRITTYVFLPRNAKPPFQTVVFFPGADAAVLRTSRNLWLRVVDFFIRSGRVLVYPVYQGTYERQSGAELGPHGFRQLRIQRTQDVRRTLDYLATRPDIDSQRVIFYGLSMGAIQAPFVLATEKRFRGAVLFGGGLYPSDDLPEVQLTSYLPRVELPVLFVGGRYDFTFPYETSQKPFYERLGTPADRKEYFLYDGGHIPTQFNEAVRAILDWTDRELGPVIPAGG